MSPIAATSRDAEAKLQHILLHAAQIFAQQGFEGASIRDISKATGVSLSGLYYYFESKQKLLYLLQVNAFSSILESAQSRLAEVTGPEARLHLLVQNHVGYFLSHPNEMKVLAHEEEALDEPYRAEVAAIKRRYYDLAREIFEDVAGDAILSTGLSSRIAVLSLFGMMNWIYKWHKPSAPNAEELSNAIVKIFLHGVLGEAADEKLLSTTAEHAVDLD